MHVTIDNKWFQTEASCPLFTRFCWSAGDGSGFGVRRRDTDGDTSGDGEVGGKRASRPSGPRSCGETLVQVMEFSTHWHFGARGCRRLTHRGGGGLLSHVEGRGSCCDDVRVASTRGQMRHLFLSSVQFPHLATRRRPSPPCGGRRC